MILESIYNFNLAPLPNAIVECVNLLKETNFETIPEGTYKVKGDDIYYAVQEYTSLRRDGVQAEIHKKYCDIQFMCSGREAIGWSSWNENCDISSYDLQKDIAFFDALENESLLLLESGMFVFFAPYEIHRPRLEYKIGQKSNVKKIVIKINSEIL